MAAVLDGAHRIQLLLYLLKNGPKTKEDLRAELKLNPTVLKDSTLPALLEAGLIMQVIELRGIRKTRAHVISLTPPGKQVAELLARIDEIVIRAKKTVQVKA